MKLPCHKCAAIHCGLWVWRRKAQPRVGHEPSGPQRVKLLNHGQPIYAMLEGSHELPQLVYDSLQLCGLYKIWGFHYRLPSEGPF